MPAVDWIGWAVEAYLRFIEPEFAPDAMLLWLCEPDESFHALGIGSPESLVAINRADALFGRILAHHRAAIEAGELHVIAMSDHGQITLEGAPLDLPARLGAAGFLASGRGLDGNDCVLGVDSAGGIWLRDRDPALSERLVGWLLTQPWCGPLFTRDGVLGTLRTAEVGLDHARGPDISLTLRSHAGPNAHGLPGMTVHDARYPVGGGCHGGLNRHELATVLAMGGMALRTGVEVGVAGGHDGHRADAAEPARRAGGGDGGAAAGRGISRRPRPCGCRLVASDARLGQRGGPQDAALCRPGRRRSLSRRGGGRVSRRDAGVAQSSEKR